MPGKWFVLISGRGCCKLRYKCILHRELSRGALISLFSTFLAKQPMQERKQHPRIERCILDLRLLQRALRPVAALQPLVQRLAEDPHAELTEALAGT